MVKNHSLEELENRIGYTFCDNTLLLQALTHSSYTNEQKINKQRNYERLEYLGDAVLELVTSEFLFQRYEDMPEGQLSKTRSSMVCEPALAFCARDLELGNFIRLGKGEEISGGRNRDSIISDVMEAVIGAIYLDGGFEVAGDFIRKFILSDLENKQLFYDSKTLLQELVQSMYHSNVTYELLEEKGPEHDKLFLVHACINGNIISKGEGRTKKAAEQQAAYDALMILKKEEKKTKG